MHLHAHMHCLVLCCNMHVNQVPVHLTTLIITKVIVLGVNKLLDSLVSDTGSDSAMVVSGLPFGHV